MKQMKHFIFILILSVIGCGRNPKQGLTLSNKSPEAIYYVTSFIDRIDIRDLEDINIDGEVFSIDDYQGTGKVKIDTSYRYRILPGEEGQILGGWLIEYGFRGPSAKELINENGGKVTVYVFTESFLRNTSKSTIVDEQVYSKRYMYNANDLERMNWTIKFIN